MRGIGVGDGIEVWVGVAGGSIPATGVFSSGPGPSKREQDVEKINRTEKPVNRR
jgi:hypothetical protein